MDDAIVKAVTDISNALMKKNYPLMSEKHYNEDDVKIILESLLMLLEEYDI